MIDRVPSSTSAGRVDETTLDDFFCASGKIYFAERAADGRTVHINGVRSGSACGCVCVGCGLPMLAYKGKRNRHHFQHGSGIRPECKHAGETALHRIAKEYLAEALSLTIPARELKEDGLVEVVARKSEFRFDRATLERRLHDIVPDVLVWKGARPLLIEFAVTHKCGPEKLEKIRRLEISAIEIDLSKYRATNLSDLKNAILNLAEREWLHNTREADAQFRLAARVSARATALQKEIDEFRATYSHRSPQTSQGDGDCEVWALQNGLGTTINADVDGAGCFSVPPAEWQARILLRLLTSPRSLSTLDFVKDLQQADFVLKHYVYMSRELAEAVAAVPGLRFARPFDAVLSYLNILARSGLIDRAGARAWTRRPELLAIIQRVEEARARARLRQSDELRASQMQDKNRVSDLREDAAWALGAKDAEEWLSAPLDALGARTPVQASAESPELQLQALGELEKCRLQRRS